MTPAAPASASFDEPSRQHALDRYRILDTLPQAAYDDVVKVASTVCGTPVALVSLIDRDRQWFKARVGLDDAQTSRDVAVCDHAIRAPGELMEIPDLRQDPRFAGFPAVAGDFAARFYAGMPLVTPEGAPVGTVCVIDHEPRTLTPAQREALSALARITVSLMESDRREHVHAATEALHATPPVEAASATDFTVALLELQDFAGLVARQGERATLRALTELNQSFEQCLPAGSHDVLSHVTGSAEFVAVLRSPDIAATLDRLQAEADRRRSQGLDIRVASADSARPDETLEQVYLRADQALSEAKTRTL